MGGGGVTKKIKEVFAFFLVVKRLCVCPMSWWNWWQSGRNVPRYKGLIRSYQGKPMVNKPLIRPYLWGRYIRGCRLTSHKSGNSEDGIAINKFDFQTPENGTPKTTGLPCKIQLISKECFEDVRQQKELPQEFFHLIHLLFWFFWDSNLSNKKHTWVRANTFLGPK